MKMFKSLLSLILFSALFAISSSVSAHILDGAKEWNGHYYKIFQIPMKYEDAKKFCESVGGHLAAPETSTENEMLKQMFSMCNGIDYCWIGAYRDEQRFWHWITNKVIADYFDWGKREPGGSQGDFYKTSLCFNRKKECKWANHYPSESIPFMCEWEKAEDAHESNL